MAKYRFGPKFIDTYRMYVDGDWMTKQSFIESISRTGELNIKAWIGIGFQKLVELRMLGQNLTTSDASEDYFVWEDEDHRFAFHRKCFEELDKIIPAGAVPEAKTVKRYQTSHGDVDIVSMVDAVYGLIGFDIKTSLTAMKPDNYTESFQHRFYLKDFQLKEFVWLMLQLKENKKLPHHYNFHSLKVAHEGSYDGMEQECISELNEFITFCKSMGLDKELIPYWEKEGFKYD